MDYKVILYYKNASPKRSYILNNYVCICVIKKEEIMNLKRSREEDTIGVGRGGGRGRNDVNTVLMCKILIIIITKRLYNFCEPSL